MLTYYIPFPLSFIHTKQPILQAAILATYFDSPCKKNTCTKSRTTIIHTNETNLLNRIDNTTNTTSMVTPNNTKNTSDAAKNAISVFTPELDFNITHTNETNQNKTEVKINTITDEETDFMNNMGQILRRFFSQILPTSTAETYNNTNNIVYSDISNSELLKANRTAKKTTTDSDEMKILMVNQTDPSIGHLMNDKRGGNKNEIVNNNNRNNDNNQQQERLNRFNFKTITTTTNNVEDSSSITSTCNNCDQWSTERLLKARLCCLNFQSELDDEESDFQSLPPSPPPSNVANQTDQSSQQSNSETTNSTITDDNDIMFETNGTFVQDGSFGCQLYAKCRCNRIMPQIKCCLRKMLKKYFDFTIKIREQQLKNHQQEQPKHFMFGNSVASEQWSSMKRLHNEAILPSMSSSSFTSSPEIPSSPLLSK